MHQNAAVLRASLLLVAAACSGGRSAAPAPTPPPPDRIPAPLAAALIGGAGGAAAARTITVGTLPPGYPAELVPPPTFATLGGMRRGGEIIAIFEDSTRRLPTILGEQLTRAGYMRPPEPTGSGFSPPFRGYSSYCRDGSFVTASPMAGDATQLRVTVRRMPDRPCDVERMATEEARLVLPELKPPTGVRVQRQGGSANVQQAESRAEVMGKDLVPAAILAHYTKQLVDAGWTADEPAMSPRVAAQYLEARDTAGNAWQGVLTASGSDTSLVLTLTMTRRSAP